LIIKVQLSDVLKDKLRNKSQTGSGQLNIELNPGSTLYDLFDELGLSVSQVGLVILNGKQVNYKHLISDQDQVRIFSPMSGG